MIKAFRVVSGLSYKRLCCPFSSHVIKKSSLEYFLLQGITRRTDVILATTRTSVQEKQCGIAEIVMGYYVIMERRMTFFTHITQNCKHSKSTII